MNDPSFIRADATESADGAKAAHERMKPVPLAMKLTYGLGSLADGISIAAINTFIFFYLTSVCGLSGTLTGLAFFLALGIDAIVDPLVGGLSDRARSKWGRRHPFMVAGLLPLALATALVFSIPAELGGILLFGYLFVLLLAVRCAQSLYNIPYIALGAELTDNYHDRSVIAAVRAFVGILANVTPVVLGYSIFLKGPALHERAAYVQYGWACAAVLLVAGLLSAIGTLRLRARFHATNDERGPSPGALVGDIAQLFRAPSFGLLFSVVSLFLIAWGVAISLQLHVGKYFWRMSDEVLQAFTVAFYVAPVIGIPMAAFLIKRLDKKNLVIAAMVTLALLQAVPIALALIGVLPASGLGRDGVLLACGLAQGAALAGCAIGFQSLMVDAIDEHELAFGVRREGLYFAGLSFALKLASGTAGLLVGLALDIVHFPTNALVADVPRDTVWSLAVLQGPVLALLFLASAAMMSRLKLNAKTHATILAALNQKRAAGERAGGQ